MLYTLLRRVVLGPPLSALYRPHVTGREHVPARGGAVIASNHRSFFDSVLLPLVLDRRVTFPAKQEYFTQPGLKGRAVAAFFRAVGQIPIDRSGGERSAQALEAARAVLRRGGLIGIYPEGTRSPDGRLHRGRTGAVRLAVAAGVPIVPVGLIGTAEVQPVGVTVPRVRPTRVRFGEPLEVAHIAALPEAEQRAAVRAATDELMERIRVLCGQEYSGLDAGEVKRRLQEAARAGVGSTGESAPR